MILGFSGTRRGMSKRQRGIVISVLMRLAPTELHHGDCVGADAQINEIAHQLGIPIHLHPPDNPALRAHCVDGVRKVYPEKDYLARDRDIVKASDLILATPLSNGKSQRGGTWYVIKQAGSKKKDLIICFTNGDMVLSRRDLLDG